MAGTGFPRGSPQADFGQQDHRAESQLPGAASYSHWRPFAGAPDGPVQAPVRAKRRERHRITRLPVSLLPKIKDKDITYVTAYYRRLR